MSSVSAAAGAAKQTDMHAEMDLMRAELDLNILAAETYRQKLEESQKGIQERDQTIAVLNQQVAELKKAFGTLNDWHKENCEILAAKESQLKDAEAVIDELQSALVEIKAAANQYRMESLSAEQLLRDEDELIRSYEATQAHMEEVCSKYNSELKAYEEMCLNLANDLQTCKTSIARYEGDLHQQKAFETDLKSLAQNPLVMSLPIVLLNEAIWSHSATLSQAYTGFLKACIVGNLWKYECHAYELCMIAMRLLHKAIKFSAYLDVTLFRDAEDTLKALPKEKLFYARWALDTLECLSDLIQHLNAFLEMTISTDLPSLMRLLRVPGPSSAQDPNQSAPVTSFLSNVLLTCEEVAMNYLIDSAKRGTLSSTSPISGLQNCVKELKPVLAGSNFQLNTVQCFGETPEHHYGILLTTVYALLQKIKCALISLVLVQSTIGQAVLPDDVWKGILAMLYHLSEILMTKADAYSSGLLRQPRWLYIRLTEHQAQGSQFVKSLQETTTHFAQSVREILQTHTADINLKRQLTADLKTLGMLIKELLTICSDDDFAFPRPPIKSIHQTSAETVFQRVHALALPDSPSKKGSFAKRLQTELEALQKSHNEITAQLQSVQQQYAEARLNVERLTLATRELDQMRGTHGHNVRRITTLQSQLESSQKEKMKLSEEIILLKSQLESLSKVQQTLGRASPKRSNVRSPLEQNAVELLNSQLRNELASLQAQNVPSQLKCSSLDSQLNKLATLKALASERARESSPFRSLQTLQAQYLSHLLKVPLPVVGQNRESYGRERKQYLDSSASLAFQILTAKETLLINTRRSATHFGLSPRIQFDMKTQLLGKVTLPSPDPSTKSPNAVFKLHVTSEQLHQLHSALSMPELVAIE